MLTARIIALYLPQFHPVPENNQWWGKGFTEWTNVAKAKPLFRGHYQPHIPADLGFYDLRLPEAREAQATMARAHGVEGFCYWHYWFSGRRILARPFQEVLESGKPNFPFCLAWANQTWSGIWHGHPKKVLIEQSYPGIKDYTEHFNALLPAFRDPRYLRVDGKVIFGVYKPQEIPNPREFTDVWHNLATCALDGIHLVGFGEPGWDPIPSGFDAVIPAEPGTSIRFADLSTHPTIATARRYWRCAKRRLMQRPHTYEHATIVAAAERATSIADNVYPCVLPNWDNTPRSTLRGIVFSGSTPALFRRHLRHAIELVATRPADHRIIILKSWNEWAEGNHVEPDLRDGLGYLDVIAKEVAPPHDTQRSPAPSYVR